MNVPAPPAARASGERRGPTGAAAAAIILAGSAVLAAFADAEAQAFYQIVQEDGVIEWATFWAFLFSCLAFVRAAARVPSGSAWLFLLAAFSFFVAFEEISWAQRILGYRAPVYFLEHNFQQELNLHNVASQSLREWLWVAVLGGWGVALPLLARVGRLRTLARRHALVYPPLGLVPVFGAALALQLSYPLPFTGEIVELMFGVALLFVALAQEPSPKALSAWPALLALVAASAAASSAWSLHRPSSAASSAAVHAELAALAGDFAEIARGRGEAPTGCGLHKRVYTFATKYGVGELERLQFAALASSGVPRERITYFLDPWNSPYWVRDQCSRNGRRRAAFVYSLGPNQRRDSSAWELGGDDVGIYLVRNLRRASERRPGSRARCAAGTSRSPDTS